ncbi:MAG: potassium/proton antiporter [Actinomycetes bacterium]
MSPDHLLLLGAVVVLVAVLAARLGARFGLPSLLLFLGVGLALPLVGFDLHDPDLAHNLGFAALVFILAEGGLTTKWEDVRPALGVASLLATVGVLASLGVVAVFGHFVLGLPVVAAALLGAITAPTDSAAIFSVLRHVPLPPRMRAILESESGLNDAPIVLLVALFTAFSLGQEGHESPLVAVALIAGEFAGGLLLGAAMGWLGSKILKTVALPASGLYPLAVMGLIVLAYGVGVVLHVSGFAAVYVCAVILGNAELQHRNATRSFAEGLGWVCQIGLFVMLGMLAEPERLTWVVVVNGLLIGGFVTLIARPLSVAVCAVWFKITVRQQMFISWAGLRGAVPIIMATVPLAAGVNSAVLLFDEVFVFVVAFTLVQAPTRPFVAHWLGVADERDSIDIEVESAPLERMKADFMQVTVPPGSKLHGVTVKELRMPRFSVIAVIIRRGEPLTPAPNDAIREGDELLIVVPSARRRALEERLRAVGRAGRLAGWLRRPGQEEPRPSR